VLLSASFALVVALGARIAQLSLQASAVFRDYYTGLDVGGAISSGGGYLLEGFSLGLIPAGSAKDDLAAAMLNGAMTLQSAADAYASWFLWAALAFVVLGYVGSLWPADSRRWTRCLVLLAIVCMVVGQVAPVMSMTSTMDIPVVGECVVAHESKSILTAIVGLLSSGKVWVAMLIILFSLVVPTGKLLTCLVAARTTSSRVTAAALRVVAAIGKWSMADVFVVAVLLTIFSLRSDGDVGARHRSEPGIGLWFFTTHCLLAMVAAHLISRRRPEQSLPEGGPSTLPQVLVQGIAFVISLVGAMSVLRPATHAEHDVVIDVGHRWACSVLAPGDGVALRGNWHSSGVSLGGADDTMVAVYLMGPGGEPLREYDHKTEGSFDLRVPRAGVYTLVFSNAGIIRSTPRSVQARLVTEPNGLSLW
jgi:paraquat-inducible protein A